MLHDWLEVLVVDDDLPIRESMCLLLEDAEYRVRGAQDGVEALAQLRAATRSFVVVLDYVMPRLNGLDVLRAVAADEELMASSAFVLCSAQAHILPQELHELCERLGVELLAKPFELDDLLAMIARAAQRLAQRLDASQTAPRTITSRLVDGGEFGGFQSL
ncbi:MAG TPA: response regulator [Ktedonobacterales bacterium]